MVYQGRSEEAGALGRAERLTMLVNRAKRLGWSAGCLRATQKGQLGGHMT